MAHSYNVSQNRLSSFFALYHFSRISSVRFKLWPCDSPFYSSWPTKFPKFYHNIYNISFSTFFSCFSSSIQELLVQVSNYGLISPLLLLPPFGPLAAYGPLNFSNCHQGIWLNFRYPAIEK